MAAGICAISASPAFAALPVPSAVRRLNLRNENTGETFAGIYRNREGLIPDAVDDLAAFLRDHHVNKEGPVDIRVLDFLADVLEATGQGKATITSAFRTPATNRKLSVRIFGVAEKSQHLLGHAVDFTLPARLSDAKDAALRLKRGGVGWYPKAQFIHLDSGPVRQWQIDAGHDDDDDHAPRVAANGKKVTVLRGQPTVAERMKIHRNLARREFLARQGS